MCGFVVELRLTLEKSVDCSYQACIDRIDRLELHARAGQGYSNGAAMSD